MLTLIIVLLLLNYLFLPWTKDVFISTFETWSKAWGIVYLVPGISLFTAICILVAITALVLIGCIQMAFDGDEKFFKKYFDKY